MDHCEYEADKFHTQPEKLWGFFDFALPTNKIIERQTCLKGKKDYPPMHRPTYQCFPAYLQADYISHIYLQPMENRNFI